MEFSYSKFLAIWQIIILGLAIVSAIAGIVIFIIHKARLSSISNYKQKYDYLGTYDAKMIFYIIVAFSVALILFINTVYDETVLLGVVWFFVRMFIAICVGTLIIYVSY